MSEIEDHLSERKKEEIERAKKQAKREKTKYGSLIEDNE